MKNNKAARTGGLVHTDEETIRKQVSTEGVANAPVDVTPSLKTEEALSAWTFGGSSPPGTVLVPLTQGLFAPEDAARAYDIAAIERWGTFALTNEALGLFDHTVEVAS